jgi:hypothetical protein
LGGHPLQNSNAAFQALAVNPQRRNHIFAGGQIKFLIAFRHFHRIGL